MKNQTLGTMIARLRKEKEMTQAQLADKMNVTDKAVSKWERGLSCPDVGTLPRLAEIFGVSVDELMQVRERGGAGGGQRAGEIAALVFKAVALAMGVAVTVLSILGSLEAKTAVMMLGIGLACAAVSLFKNGGDDRD